MKLSLHRTGASDSPCRERSHIPPFAFSLWDWMNGVCLSQKVESFTLYPTRAALYVCSQKRQVRYTAEWLTKNGWLEVLKKPRRGIGGAGTYRVVRHAEWTKKHGHKKCPRIHYDKATGEALNE